MKKMVSLVLILLVCVCALSEAPDTAPGLQVHFIAVGRNDGILIVCDGEAAFIDSGSHSRGDDCVKYMKQQGIDHLKYYIGTHAHTDHVGGAPAILAAIPTDMILTNYKLAITAMRDSAYNANERSIVDSTPWTEVHKGDEFVLGGAKLVCVGPNSLNKRAKYTDGLENENSLIFRLEYGNHSFLFTGDTTNEILAKLLTADPDLLKCTVFKSPHHNIGLHDEIAAKLQCEYYVFSTGTDDPPSLHQINNARRAGGRVFITSYNNSGTVVFYSDGETMTHTTQYKLDNWKLSASSSFTLRVGKHQSISVNMKPSRMIDTINWASSNPAVATVDPTNGKVTAVSEGVCYIRALGFDDSYRIIKVTVKAAK